VFAVIRPLNSFVELAFANALFPVTVIPPLKMLSALYVFAVVVEKAVLNTPVEELYASGYTAESDVEEILLLKVLKSVDARYPSTDVDEREIEIALLLILSGTFAVVMRFWYAVFQSVVEAVSGMVYPAVSEKTPVAELYERPVAVEVRSVRAALEKSLIVEASCVPVWFARLRKYVESSPSKRSAFRPDPEPDTEDVENVNTPVLELYESGDDAERSPRMYASEGPLSVFPTQARFVPAVIRDDGV
jgi:hypothetical protein